MNIKFSNSLDKKKKKVERKLKPVEFLSFFLICYSLTFIWTHLLYATTEVWDVILL